MQADEAAARGREPGGEGRLAVVGQDLVRIGKEGDELEGREAGVGEERLVVGDGRVEGARLGA